MIDNKDKTFNMLAPDQFRLAQLQVFNWGTFSNLHTIPISSRGFLFVGRSGSGKSTLLDAISALIIPARWVDFNAAAREINRNSRDRNFVTYVRGAWSEQINNLNGQIATQYLRTGTTWSALALTYQTPTGDTVVLVQVFWLRGNSNNNTDVRRHFFIFERPFDLREMENFDLNIRALKQSFAQAAIFDDFTPYCERFCRLLGIDNKMALRLLHKTQSAKNLGDLNAFLRDFMLDKPDTFTVAERLVIEFSELNSAHQTVVTARQQMAILEPARNNAELLANNKIKANNLRELIIGIDCYQERLQKNLLENLIVALKIKLESDTSQVTIITHLLSAHHTELHYLIQQQSDLGGNQIAQLELEKQQVDSQLDLRLNKRRQAQEACQTLEWLLPENPQSFAELTNYARQELERGQDLTDSNRDKQFNLVKNRCELENEFSAIRKEVQALKTQTSNIPADMLELRKTIAKDLNLNENALPFAGELIDIKHQESHWQGAIERLLRGFALSLLVEEKYYGSFSNYINSKHLGKRIVYLRMSVNYFKVNKSIALDSVIQKLIIKDGNYQEWLKEELKQRYDYTCAENLQAFKTLEKALTLEGQIRHGKSRHEKDDRRQLNDRLNWVLGFNNREKLNLCEREAQILADKLSLLSQEINTLSQSDKIRKYRDTCCQMLVNIQWQEIDVAPLLDRIEAIKQKLHDTLHGNQDLQMINKLIAQQRIDIETTDSNLRNARIEQEQTNKQINANLEKVIKITNNPKLDLTPYQNDNIALYYEKITKELTLDNLDESSRKVERKIVAEADLLNTECNKLKTTIENSFAEYKRKWPMDASDLDPNIHSAPDFFSKLQRLELDGLPAYEQRFFELLENQSHQNLAALATHLSQARKEIFKRMDLVNESLRQAPFNPGTFLRIEAQDRQLSDVREFKQQIQQALSYAWTNDKEHAETRFIILSELVKKLSSAEPEQKRWVESVLDVRLHVEFIGIEFDCENKIIETHRSGAGKSGGQRQKLATTCLAAALRYQLGGDEHYPPTYAPVILDEAFDKADNEFTALAMNVFASLGFQMIVATPLKSVMTLEPFIGGACFVDIADRKKSSIFMIEYNEELHRLNVMSNNTHESTSPATP
jgi:uncharacterized protein YPO0396